MLIEVAFKGNRKEFFDWDGPEAPPVRAPVIVEADRGEDLGRVHTVGDLAIKRSRATPHGLGDGAPERHARRLATADDVRREAELRIQDEDARRRAAERVRANGLAMKLTDAEWQWDRKKLTFYFTADKRVDFRLLVRELAAMFRTRIELKQIGVRDEARRLDGVGRCGRQYCSASWLPELRPVNLGVAKDQRLSLNPSQISGACGRLMCSLRYEHDFYVSSRRRFPKEGRLLQTARGEEKVVANDIFRDRVTLRAADGEFRTILLSELCHEVERVAKDLGLPAPVIGTLGHAGNLQRNGDATGAGKPVSDDASGGVDVDVSSAGDSEDTEPHLDDEEVSAEAELPDEAAPAPANPLESAAQVEGRPRRRRGRRGGRRNRPGGTRGARTEGEEPPTGDA